MRQPERVPDDDVIVGIVVEKSAHTNILYTSSTPLRTRRSVHAARIAIVRPQSPRLDGIDEDVPVPKRGYLPVQAFDISSLS